MKRAILFSALLFLLPTVPGHGQEAAQRQAAHLYEAYYRLGYDQMADWNRLFETYSLPVLEALQSEGVIAGWGHWQHNVGGEYNVRFAVRVYDWAAIDTFWSEYFDRMFESMSEADRDLAFRIIDAHHDEIWDLGSVTFGETAGTNAIMYASTFNVNFADMAEWNRIWNEVSVPVLQEAMVEGILNGVVLLNHNTGGAHNSKVLYMFEDWDDIDDMWNHFFSTMEERHPEDFMTALGLVEAHDDIIWSAAPGN